MSNSINFSEVSTMWNEEKQKYVKRSTMSVYQLHLKRHLIPVFGEMTAVSEETVQSFVTRKLDSGLSQKSVRDMLIVLKMVIRFGAKLGVFTYPDWEIRFPPEAPRRIAPVFPLDHQRKLTAYLYSHFSFRNLGILICLNTGLRIGEICALKWNDINEQFAIITVTKTMERIYLIENDETHTELIVSSPKTKNSYREIPITGKLMKMIRSIKERKNKDHYIISNSPHPIEPRTYRNYFRKLLDSLAIPEIKFHGLRHSFATRCIESKCDYKTVSAILGHSNITTTMNLYVHPNIEHKKRCIDRMVKSLGKQ